MTKNKINFRKGCLDERGDLLGDGKAVICQNSDSDLYCTCCSNKCHLFTGPFIGNFKHVGFEFAWTILFRICGGIEIEFDEFYINNERFLFHDKRPI